MLKQPVCPCRQRGIVLIITLLVLVAMMLAGAALTRSVDTTNVIAGNLAFRHGAIHAADICVETAIDWLETNSATDLLYVDDGGHGYRAAWQDPDFANGQTWDGFWKSTLVPAGIVFNLPIDEQGNTIPWAITDGVFRPRAAFVIQRLCNAPGDPNDTAVDCAPSPAVKLTGNSKGAGVKSLESSSQIYYRITCRMTGPGSTTSYVQVLVLI